MKPDEAVKLAVSLTESLLDKGKVTLSQKNMVDSILPLIQDLAKGLMDIEKKL